MLDTNINRSPSAYLNNPPEERAAFSHNVDKDMTLLKFSSADGTPVGALNWFPVHCVSMNRSNTLVSGDNKGAASRMFEDWHTGLGDRILQQGHAGGGKGEGEGEGEGEGVEGRWRRKGMAQFEASFEGKGAALRGVDV